jgi:hypothetical protein
MTAHGKRKKWSARATKPCAQCPRERTACRGFCCLPSSASGSQPRRMEEDTN